MIIRFICLRSLPVVAVFLAGISTLHAQTIPNVCLNTDLVSSYRELYHRDITSAECRAAYYNNGKWSSKDELKRYIQQYQAGQSHAPVPVVAVLRAPDGQYLVTPSGALVDSNASIVAAAGSFVFSPIVASGGGNIVASGGGNVILPQPGMIVASGGGNLSQQRSLQSVDGKRMLKVTVVKK